MRINQFYMSDSLRWFRKGFIEKYGMVDYHDTHLPCIFVGVYGDGNVKKILDHKGFKIVMFCGSDITHAHKLSNDKNISGYLSDMHIYELRIKEILDVKKYLTIPIKSFADFKPVPLGDKIYFYGRTDRDIWTDVFRKNLLDIIISNYGEDKVLIGLQGHTIEEMRENYYSKSFINLNFTKEVGFTSCLEMAHMGRISVSNYPAKFCFPYQDLRDILMIIEKESEKIGTVRDDVAQMANDYYSKDESWLNTESWE